MTGEDFRERYLAAFASYVDSPGEDALRAAYELGRSAVRRRLSVLDLACAHHDALLAAAERPPEGLRTVMRAAGDFFLEAVSAFEMLQRALQEARETAAVAHRHAVVLRQLSSFLADASIALDASSSIGEMLQLVAEHARELLEAERCVVRLAIDGDELEAEALAGAGPDAAGGARIAAPLTALDGRDVGVVELYSRRGHDFGEVDEAVLVQLAQMASAAFERAQLYRR